MKLADLKTAKGTCVACKAFTAECLVPVGEAAVPMCWLCAHHVIDHDTLVHEALEARCECTPEDVYPASVLAKRHGIPSTVAGRSRFNDLQRRYAKHLPFITRSTRLLRS